MQDDPWAARAKGHDADEFAKLPVLELAR